MRSTIFSADTTWTWGASNTSFSGPYTATQSRLDQSKQREPENLETIIDRLNLERFSILSEDEREHRLEQTDAVDLFNAVQELNKELSNVRIENFVLTDFLEKNDPKLLIGLVERRETLRKTIAGGEIMSLGRGSLSARSLSASLSGTGLQDRRRNEYKLNYRTKSEMVDKLAIELERRIRELETKEMQNVKYFNAQIEELSILYEETVGTIKNFKLHFLTDNKDLMLLEYGTEKQMEQNFRKFVNSWLKNSRALLSTMRLRSTTLQETCQQLRAELITKSDLSGILSSVDFEQLINKRNALLVALEEKNVDMAGLKGVTGKASMAMAREKQVMMAIEADTQSITQKTTEIQRQNIKLEREIDMVKAGNERDRTNLNRLKNQLELFEAPTINNYIEMKDELHTLEKEEKKLQRKISILNLKLSTLTKRCKNLGLKSYIKN